MDIKKSELVHFGKAYDLAELSCFVLNRNFEILYTNDYAIQLFNLNNQSIEGESFTTIWPYQLFPKVVNSSDKIFNGVPVKIGDLYITWKMHAFSVDSNPMILLLQENNTALVKLNEQLDEKCKSIIGHSYKQHNPSPETYINEIVNYLHSIIDKIPCYIYWKNSDLKYLGCNKLAAEFINLKSPAEIIGKSDFDVFINKSLAESYRNTDKTIIETGVPILNEIGELSRENGEILNTLVSKVPINDISGNIVGLVGITVDITELRKTHEELKKAKEVAEAAARAKTEFIANMSHDIRTPLTGVIGLSNMLKEQLKNPTHKQEAILLSKSGEQLLTMLNEILDNIRADTSHEADIFEDSFDLYKCIQDLIELESPTTTSKHLGLEFNIKPEVPQFLISDRKKIHHILLNLLGNAVKFTKTGKITIEVNCLDRTDTHVHLQFGVADTGIGIPQELQAKVFERFFRVDPAYKGRYEGYGLGLHIVQSYVNLLGGHVTLSSQEGMGTTFYFDLICAIGNKENESAILDENTHDKSQVITPSPTPSSLIITEVNQILAHEKPTVLLVEDDAIALIVVENLARKAQMNFLSAKDGESALELAKAHDFKLIITDLGLPGISGMVLAKFIRDWEHEQNKPSSIIVGLSAHVHDQVLKECIDAGMNDGFSKPMTLDVMSKLKNTYL